MREGGLEAPTRHPLDWQNPEFYDAAKLDEEMRRVLDICHGCRRCFNLCDSFPRLFDIVDESKNGELDTVASADFAGVVDACTLCDMCYLTKCPYVPPHEFNLDFPHLMVRYRAVEAKKNGVSFADRTLAETDRNGKIGTSRFRRRQLGAELRQQVHAGRRRKNLPHRSAGGAAALCGQAARRRLPKTRPTSATQRRRPRRARR